MRPRHHIGGEGMMLAIAARRAARGPVGVEPAAASACSIARTGVAPMPALRSTTGPLPEAAEDEAPRAARR